MKKIATLNQDTLKKRKRKRWRAVAMLTVVELLISPVAVSILHNFFTYVLSFRSTVGFDIDLDYVSAVNLCLFNTNARALWLGIEAMWIVAILFFTLNTGAKLHPVDTVMVTPDIEKPVPAGNGQYGNERFLTENEKRKIFGEFTFTGTEVLDEKAGLVVQMTKSGGKENILFLKEDLHALVIGASGSGKTRRLLLVTIWLQLLSGLSIVVSDVKGEIFYFTGQFAGRMGYTKLWLDFRNPKKSMHYNFLQPVLDALGEQDTPKAVDYTWDIVSVLVGEPKGEPIWYNGECASIAAAILIVAMEAPEGCKNLTNVYYFLAYMCEPDAFGNMPLKAYLDKQPDTHPAKGIFQQAKIAPYKTRSSFYTSALGTLRLFTNPNVAEMMSRSDFSLKDISKQKTIFYMIIPDEKKTNYPLVSLLVTQMYMMQVELAGENGLEVPVHTDYDLDELGNFPKIPVLPDIVSAGRSRGIRMNGIIQDYQQLEKKYKDDFRNIKANCQLKIYLKSDDTGTLKEISGTLGTYTVEVSSASTSVSDNAGKRDGVNYSSSANLAACNLLAPAELKRIKPPYALCMLTGDYPAINVLPDISEYFLNGIYGMGGREHNNRLMAGIEAQRRENRIPVPTLWGIWKEYQKKQEGQEAQETSVRKRVSFLD